MAHLVFPVLIGKETTKQERKQVMIKENAINTTQKSYITPRAFVKECPAVADVPSYDWNTQKNTVMCFGTARQTFRPPLEQWESD